MARLKVTPEVAKPTPRQRLIEWGKDLLILVLVCSAFYLAGQTPMADQLRLLTARPDRTGAASATRSEEAAVPYALAIRGGMGLYSAAYDEVQVNRAFAQVSPLLGEALSSAETPEPITPRQWRELLDSPCIYCVFQGAPPLSALQGWLGSGGRQLSGGAESLLLAAADDKVWLCWRENGAYYRAATALSQADRLSPLVDAYSPNGAAFAATLAGEDPVYAALDGDVLVSLTVPRPRIYALSSPDFVDDTAALERLLAELGFQSGVNSAYQTAGDLAINESGDRLRIGKTGTVTFHAGGEARYPISSKGDVPTLSECVQTAWELLDKASTPWRGEGDYVLAGAESTENGWIITFHARLNGIPVLTGQEGWVAQFTTERREISSFSLTLRSYTPTDSTGVVATQRLAAAAINSLPAANGRLTLCYSDMGGASLGAGWVCVE